MATKKKLPPVQEVPADVGKAQSGSPSFRVFLVGGGLLLGFALLMYWLAHRVQQPATTQAEAGTFLADAGNTVVRNGTPGSTTSGIPTVTGPGAGDLDTDHDKGTHGPPLHLPGAGSGSVPTVPITTGGNLPPPVFLGPPVHVQPIQQTHIAPPITSTAAPPARTVYQHLQVQAARLDRVMQRLATPWRAPSPRTIATRDNRLALLDRFGRGV